MAISSDHALWVVDEPLLQAEGQNRFQATAHILIEKSLTVENRIAQRQRLQKEKP